VSIRALPGPVAATGATAAAVDDAAAEEYDADVAEGTNDDEAEEVGSD
jgi:hypothetical protein